MKVIEQSYQILSIAYNTLYQIERAGRTCYKSEEKISEGSEIHFAKMLRDSGHHAMLEFGDIAVRFITNRGVTHELVRHRLCSFAQESTRYVKYDGQMEFILPVWWNEVDEESQAIWMEAMKESEQNYRILRRKGWRPEQAREVLPNSLKTEIVVKANTREWRHIFQLRCSSKAHPQMRALMRPLHRDIKGVIPIIYDDIKY